MTTAVETSPAYGVIYRHTLPVRMSHWLNVAFLVILLLSGLQIFNAHPALYWGQYGANNDPSFISIRAAQNGDEIKGITHVGPFSWDTTGFLGASDVNGHLQARAFPSWLTLPSYRDLSTGRHWHFLFAWLFVINGLLYLGHGINSRHFRRDLLPRAEEFRTSHLLREVVDHAKLRFPKGEQARRYNTLQKLAYLAVVFGLLPLIVLTGLTMSPGFNAVAPWLVDIFCGRQSARTLHFLCATALVSFVFVHIAMVVVSGALNNLRSMTTGYYHLRSVGGE